MGRMPQRHRFYTPDAAIAGGRILLPEDEAHHALRVVRLRDGDAAECFDGVGQVWRGTLESQGKRGAAIVVADHTAEPPHARRLTLVQAWLHKPKAIEDLLRRGAEVGVTGFVFFRAARSERSPALHPKWQALLAEVCKQSGANWMPTVEIAADAVAWLKSSGVPSAVASLDADAVPLDALPPSPEQALLVGPEGDFTPEEYAAFRDAGAQGFSLGGRVYRSEAAAILAATVLLFRAGAYRPGV
jgi:16S rRNA (uracil1498-N3)-methyltransferase